jgi:hypothetical protein
VNWGALEAVAAGLVTAVVVVGLVWLYVTHSPAAFRHKADEHYLEARDAVLAAVRHLPKRKVVVRSADGTVFQVARRPPLRIYLLMVGCKGTTFSFGRDGRVDLGGNRGRSLSQAMRDGHHSWASRAELFKMAEQLKTAKPVKR